MTIIHIHLSIVYNVKFVFFNMFIALIPNDSKLTSSRGASYKPIIYIFSSAGRELAAIRVIYICLSVMESPSFLYVKCVCVIINSHVL